MLDKDEHQLLIDASVLYYLEGKTQSQIAKELYISRPKVSRLLKKAREQQIVDITINYQNYKFDSLRGELRRRFNVPNVLITKTLSDETATLREVGKAAAGELNMFLHDDMTLGISWGKHVRMTSKYLKRYAYNNMRIVELFGAISYDMNEVDMLSIGRSISSKLNGKLYPLPSPIYIKDPIAKKAIIETPIIRKTLTMIEECDLILTGIGAIGNDLQTLWDNYVEKDMKNQIINDGGIGFILAHFFNENGEFLDTEIKEYLIGIKTEIIYEKKIFAIESGKEKEKSILAALR
jgi:DNA-binding transcriptional regulator LsrR (DeoR family)